MSGDRGGKYGLVWVFVICVAVIAVAVFVFGG
jgi:hypothetical protein